VHSLASSISIVRACSVSRIHHISIAPASGGSAAPHGNYASREGIQLKPKTLCSLGLGFRSFEAAGLFSNLYASILGHICGMAREVKAEVQIKKNNVDRKMKMQYLRSSSR
jgi:hypothetical protein